MIKNKLCFGLALMVVGSVFAMDQKERDHKSIIWPMMALQKIDLQGSGLPKEIRQNILQLYIEKYFSEKSGVPCNGHSGFDNKTRINCTLAELNDPERLARHNGGKFSLADIMFLDFKEKQSLVLAEKCIEESIITRSRDFMGNLVVWQFDKYMPNSEEYKDVLTLSLSIRRKLGTNCDVLVRAGQYDLSSDDESSLVIAGVLGGFGAYAYAGIKGEMSVLSALASAGIGAGVFGSSYYLKTLLYKHNNPKANQFLRKQKPVLPEAHSPLHKLYWQMSFDQLKKSCWKSPANTQQLKGRE